MKKYGIIGFGYGALNAVERIRHLDAAGEICVYEMALGAANPMLTTYYAAGRIERDRMTPFGTIESLAERFRFRIIPSRAEKLDPADMSVFSGQSRETFDRILVATGASAFVPNIIGLTENRERIFTMRTPSDAERLRTYLDNHPLKTAVVAGASMVGIKVAELLCERGIRVELSDMADHLFPTASDAKVANKLQKAISTRGIAFRFGVALTEIDAQNAIYADGSRCEADILCLCIGTRPNTALAQDALDIRRGISVDKRMETSVKNIFACGDCCEAQDLLSGGNNVIGLWANAAAQGKVAGENMAGGAAVYSGSIPCNITHFMDMDFVGIGMPNQNDGRPEYEKDDCYLRYTEQGGKPSANLIGKPSVSGIVKNIAVAKLREPRAHVSMFAEAALINRYGDTLANSIIGGDYGNQH